MRWKVLHIKKIEELKEQLNKKIEEGADFDTIYKISTELDKFIMEYYKNSNEEAK